MAWNGNGRLGVGLGHCGGRAARPAGRFGLGGFPIPLRPAGNGNESSSDAAACLVLGGGLVTLPMLRGVRREPSVSPAGKGNRRGDGGCHLV